MQNDRYLLFLSSVCSLCVCALDMQKKENTPTQNTVSKKPQREDKRARKHLVFLSKINLESESRREAQLEFPPYDFFKTFRIMFLDPSGTHPCIAYRKMYRTVEVELILSFLRKALVRQ